MASAATIPAPARDAQGLALARARLAEPRRPRASPWRALAAAALAAAAATGLCGAVFLGASFAPDAPRTVVAPAPAAQPAGALEHR